MIKTRRMKTRRHSIPCHSHQGACISCGAPRRTFPGLGHYQTWVPPPPAAASSSGFISKRQAGGNVWFETAVEHTQLWCCSPELIPSAAARFVPTARCPPRSQGSFGSERCLGGRISPRGTTLPSTPYSAWVRPRTTLPAQPLTRPVSRARPRGALTAHPPLPPDPAAARPRSEPAPPIGARAARTARSAVLLAGVTALRALVGCGRRQAAAGPGGVRPPLPLPAGGWVWVAAAAEPPGGRVSSIPGCSHGDNFFPARGWRVPTGLPQPSDNSRLTERPPRTAGPVPHPGAAGGARLERPWLAGVAVGEGVGEGGREGAAELPGAGRVPGSDGGAGRLPAPGAGLRGGAPGTGFSFPPSRGSSRGPAGIPAASGRPLAAHRPRPVRLWQGTAGKRRHGRGVWGPAG